MKSKTSWLKRLAVTALVMHGATAIAAERFFAGQLLVASSEMKDPRFAEAVIYMIKHDDAGAFGLVINKPVGKAAFEELLKGFGIDSKGAKGGITVYEGGPVDRQQGFVLHSDEMILASSRKVKDGIAMTADAKIIQAMAQGKGPRQALFILGYAGWAAGQLETELKINSWFVIGANKSLVFGNEADKKWRRALDKRQIPL